ncbi:MAG: ABC transporter substrate-binding protein [Coriobacteriia bacterium]|nr:ABC transporter substrate-binding protein [Coriobacteriia bacterium]MBS5478800.1 ABC transporter substrate-binding protein [Coriobacteriia bacterium]
MPTPDRIDTSASGCIPGRTCISEPAPSCSRRSFAGAMLTAAGALMAGTALPAFAASAASSSQADSLASTDAPLDLAQAAASSTPVIAVPGDTILDAAGTAFTMPVAAERIICLNNNVYDMICAFGKASSVVGVNDTTTLDPSTPDVPSFGDLSKPNVEAIIEERPDLVIAYSKRLDEGIASQIEGAGIPIARLDLYKPDTCRAELEFLGNVLQTQEFAGAFIAQMEAVQNYVARRTQGLEPLRTYWEIYADYKSVGAGSGGDQIMAMAGVANLAGSEKAGHPKVSDEWVIAANPQLIVRESSALKGATGPGVSDAANVEALYDSLASRPGWGSIDAVRDGRIIILDTAITTNPLGFMLAPLYIAREAYPERFSDVDPDALLAEVFDTYWPGESRAGIYAYTR